MTEKLQKCLGEIKQLIDKGDLSTAIKELRFAAESYPQEGIIPYYLGYLSQLGKEDKLALRFFLKSIELGYRETDVFLAAALLQKDYGRLDDAEENFKNAIKESKNDEEKWISRSALAVFYLENRKFLRADKEAKALISEFEDNYEGYHLHIICETFRGNIDEAKKCLECIPERFKTHPQYLIDKIEFAKKLGKIDLLKEVLEEEDVNRYIPEVVLREKLLTLPDSTPIDIKEKFVKELAYDYHNSDAILSMVIIEFGHKNHTKSAQLASVVLENEKDNRGIKFYLALFFQMFNFFYLSDKHPSEEVRKWIKSAGIWCISFANRVNDEDTTGIVESSVRDLFGCMGLTIED